MARRMTQEQILEERRKFLGAGPSAKRFGKALISPFRGSGVGQAFNRGGAVGVAREAGAGAADLGKRLLFGQPQQAVPTQVPVAQAAPQAPQPPQPAASPRQFFRDEAAATRADMAQGPFAPAERGVFVGGQKVQPAGLIGRLAEQPVEQAMAAIEATKPTPRAKVPFAGASQEALDRLARGSREALRREALFPGTRKVAAEFGIRQLDESGEERRTRERAQALRDAKTLEDKQALRAQFRSEDEAERARAGQERIAQINADAIVAGKAEDIALEKEKLAAADARTKTKAISDITSRFVDPMTGKANMAGAMEALAKVGLLDEATEAGVEAEVDAGAGLTASSIQEFVDSDVTADINNDGQANQADQAAIEAAKRNMIKFAQMTPEQQNEARNDPLFIKSKAVMDQIKKRASKEAERIVG